MKCEDLFCKTNIKLLKYSTVHSVLFKIFILELMCEYSLRDFVEAEMMARAPTVRSLYAGLFTLWTHTDAQVHSSELHCPSQGESQLSAASAGSSPSAAALCLKPKSPTDAASRLVPAAAAATTTPADASQQQSLRIWYLPDGDPQFASLMRFFTGATTSGDELSPTREQLASWSEIFVVNFIGF